MGYFSMVAGIDRVRHKWTSLFLTAVQRQIARTTHQVKFAFSSARPCVYSRNVMPVIQTPSHSTFPSGHASEAFALATVLEFITKGTQGAGTDPLEQHDMSRFYRMANRIAENRVVAGLHFPIDSAAGASLGCALATAIMSICDVRRQAQTQVFECKDIKMDGVVEKLSEMDFQLHSLAKFRAGSVTVHPPKQPELLSDLLQKAREEWD